MVDKALTLIKQHDVKFVDLRFTDMRGVDQHVSVNAAAVDKDFFQHGWFFDGLSVMLKPVTDSAVMDPFFDEPTVVLRCDVVDSDASSGVWHCCRGIAKRAAAYLQQTGIADAANFATDTEFYLFDEASWQVSKQVASFQLDSGVVGGRVGFSLPPLDATQDIRTAMALTLHDMGITVESHQSKLNQATIRLQHQELLSMADTMQTLKYVVHNVAHAYGKSASFMPMPSPGANGSDMHCLQSLIKNGDNIFSGNAGLSDMVLHYAGGIIKHAKVLTALANPINNNYKRLCYPSTNQRLNKSAHIQVDFPDPSANPYLVFSAMLMAGLDGIQNNIHPDKLTCTNSSTLEEALVSLEADHQFLLAGSVFTQDMLTAYSLEKREAVESDLCVNV